MPTLDDCDDAHVPAPAEHVPATAAAVDPDREAFAVFEDGAAAEAWIETTDPVEVRQ